MLKELLNNLTKEQRLELHIKGIPSQITSAWRTGKRRPTYAQAVSLAVVTGADLKDLLIEIALGDALPEDKEALESLLKD